jgi:hypothetical protein
MRHVYAIVGCRCIMWLVLCRLLDDERYHVKWA